MTDRKAVSAGVDRIEREVGSVAVLVDNAGVQHRAPLETFPCDARRHPLDANLWGVSFVGQAADQERGDRPELHA